MVSSSCEWKSKDLAVAQGKQVKKRDWIFLLPMSLCRSSAEGVAQIKGECHHTWIGDLLCPRWPWTQRPPCLSLLGFTAAMPRDLHVKIQVRNFFLQCFVNQKSSSFLLATLRKYSIYHQSDLSLKRTSIFYAFLVKLLENNTFWPRPSVAQLMESQ